MVIYLLQYFSTFIEQQKNTCTMKYYLNKN